MQSALSRDDLDHGGADDRQGAVGLRGLQHRQRRHRRWMLGQSICFLSTVLLVSLDLGQFTRYFGILFLIIVRLLTALYSCIFSSLKLFTLTFSFYHVFIQSSLFSMVYYLWVTFPYHLPIKY